MTRKFLKEVYDLKTRGDVQEYYNAWAKSYDAEVAENGYATPGRCAEALQSVGVPFDAAILDLGCGTGLSGLAMRAQGFTTIDGTDLSPGMLSQAEMRNVYRTLFASTAGSPPDITPGDYDVIAAVGVIGTGAAPASLLDVAIGLLATGGKVVFSFNDHTLKIPEFPERLAAHRGSGLVRTLYEENGPHLPGINMNSTVYILEKT